MTMAKLLLTIKCTSAEAHFGGLADALEQYRRHHPMQHVQGYIRSHWMLPLGNYSLCITPAVTRATANKTMMKKCTNFAGHFNDRFGTSILYHTHRPIEEVQGFTRSYWTPP
jgi:hypothetical protein